MPRRQLWDCVDLALPSKETTGSVHLRGRRQIPPGPWTCPYVIKTDLKSATCSNLFELKPHPGGVKLTHSLPSFQHCLPFSIGQEKCQCYQPLLKKMGLWLLGLLECTWERSLLALSCSSPPRTSLPNCHLAILKGLRICRRCMGVIFNGKDRF